MPYEGQNSEDYRPSHISIAIAPGAKATIRQPIQRSHYYTIRSPQLPTRASEQAVTLSRKRQHRSRPSAATPYVHIPQRLRK